MSDISELLEKVKAAKGPSRELDCWLFGKVGDEIAPWSDADCEYAASSPETTSHAPLYTASIDAALALVERVLPGWRAELRWGIWPKHAKRFDATLWNNDLSTRESVFGVSGNAATLPLAILAALLSALEATP